jgi:hypothetical protein
MKEEVIKCDGCNKELPLTQERFRLNLSTDKFWNGADMDILETNLEFCRVCAIHIKETLDKIAKNQKENL